MRTVNRAAAPAKLVRVDFYRMRGFRRAESLRDMCRYDLAFELDAAPGVYAFPVFQTRYGRAGGHVTHDRWRSFGVVPNATFDFEAEEKGWGAALLDPKAARTWQHPIAENGATDYGALAPLTLDEAAVWLNRP